MLTSSCQGASRRPKRFQPGIPTKSLTPRRTLVVTVTNNTIGLGTLKCSTATMCIYTRTLQNNVCMQQHMSSYIHDYFSELTSLQDSFSFWRSTTEIVALSMLSSIVCVQSDSWEWSNVSTYKLSCVRGFHLKRLSNPFVHELWISDHCHVGNIYLH